MQLRPALVAWFGLVSACAHASPSPVAAGPRPAAHVGRNSPALGETPVRLRFGSSTDLEVETAGGSHTHELDVNHLDGAALLADVAGTRGVVVPLGDLLEDPRPTTFVAEATGFCAHPWLVDIAAELIATPATLRVVPEFARVGCGPIQHADFTTGFGRERVLVYGEARFDVRMVASEMGIVRSELERMFEVRIDERWLTEVFVGPPGHHPEPRAEPHPQGLRVHLDSADGWGASGRLVVGSTIARIWLARLLEQIAPSDEANAPSPQRAALVHGLARGIARESLFELGLLSPDDYAADLDLAEVLVAERAQPWRAQGVVDARDVAAQAAARSIEVAMVAWALRDSETPMTLPQALREAALHAPGQDASQLWARLAGKITPGKLGACIVPRPVRQRVVELGYATAWDLQRAAVVTAVRDGGPAMLAGLQLGDQVRSVLAGDGPVVLRVARPGQRDTQVLEPEAAPRPVTRRGWTRRQDVADERCYPR